MANIAEYLKKILSARYGKDVRQSIHDSIEVINKEVVDYNEYVSQKAAEVAENAESASNSNTAAQKASSVAVEAQIAAVQAAQTVAELENSAKASADNAKTSEINAELSADRAALSENNAKASSETSKAYLDKVEQAGNEAVDKINNAVDVNTPNFVVDLSTGHLMYESTRLVFDVNEETGHLEWGLAV